MATSSIQVSEDTRQRLAAYKVDSMTYEDVLRLLMEVVTPEEFETLYRRWQSRVSEEFRASAKWRRRIS